MKPIKFKVWRVDVEIMIEPFTFMDISEGALNYIQEGLKDDSVILLQYTGLKDKNGKEIAENDILDDQFSCGQHFIVKWIDDIASFAHKKIVKKPDSFNLGKPDYELNKKDCLKCEIIGNLYENPELLKEDYEQEK